MVDKLDSVEVGMPVYGVDRERIGVVERVNTEGIVIKGDTVPPVAISHIDQEAVYLRGASALYQPTAQGRSDDAVALAAEDDAMLKGAAMNRQHQEQYQPATEMPLDTLPGTAPAPLAPPQQTMPTDAAARRGELGVYPSEVAAFEARTGIGRTGGTLDTMAEAEAARTRTATGYDRLTIIGVFEQPDHATAALNALQGAGFTAADISVVARDTRHREQMARDSALANDTTMSADGVATSAAVGGLLGGAAGFLVGISALVIPGIGPIVGAGILASTLVGAGVGAAAGGLVGTLGDLGVPEDEARVYEEDVRQGSTLLTVHAHNDEQAWQAQAIFDGNGGRSVRSYGIPQR